MYGYNVLKYIESKVSKHGKRYISGFGQIRALK